MGILRKARKKIRRVRKKVDRAADKLNRSRRRAQRSARKAARKAARAGRAVVRDKRVRQAAKDALKAIIIAQPGPAPDGGGPPADSPPMLDTPSA